MKMLYNVSGSIIIFHKSIPGGIQSHNKLNTVRNEVSYMQVPREEGLRQTDRQTETERDKERDKDRELSLIHI